MKCAELVARRHLGRLRREGQPEDGGDQQPAGRDEKMAGCYEPILIRGQGVNSPIRKFKFGVRT